MSHSAPVDLMSRFAIPTALYCQSFKSAKDLLIKKILNPNPRKTCYSVGFLNANSVNLAWHNGAFRNSLNKFDIVFPDGVGLRLASALASLNLKENISGTDLVPAMLNDSKTKNLRVFLLGENPCYIESVGKTFEHKFPNSQLVGTHHGYFSDEESESIIKIINEKRPDLLVVGMGTPLQENWVDKYKNKLNIKMCIVVGGIFQYWGGEKSLNRAPKIVRDLGFEWLSILLQHPHKSKRYLVGNWVFIYRVICFVLTKMHRCEK